MLIPAVFICLTIHEFCHGLVAYWLGDNTARDRGRLTLNPIAHIDIYGLICMIIAGFGWAKPVPVNPMNFKNRKAGMALVALAGPVSNILLAFVCLFFAYFNLIHFPQSDVMMAITVFLHTCGSLSVGLAVFNMIPIPPLDGSKVLMPFLPDRALEFIGKYESYIRIGFMLIIVFGLLDGVIISARSFVMDKMADLIVSILI